MRQMDKNFFKVKTARQGTIVPIVEELPYALEPVEYFVKLSGCGNKKNSVLFESADVVPKYGEKSLGSAEPCLKVTGRNEDFEIIALNKLGKRFVGFIKNDFGFCDEVKHSNSRITGKLKPKRGLVSEEERLKLTNHMDIIRRIAFKFRPAAKPFIPYAGLFGCISYDFIEQFEELPKNREDIMQDPDYLFYFLDNLFYIDHKMNKTFLVANALMMDDNYDKIYDECAGKIGYYKSVIESAAKKNNRLKHNSQKKNFAVYSDTSRQEYIRLVKKLKQHIISGDIYQAVLSRTLSLSFGKEPLDVYKKLRRLNPSPYMFYIQNNKDVLLGASPEMCLRVECEEGEEGKDGEDGKNKIVEIRPIAGTKPRGLIGGKIDIELDSRYETELKIDRKEISEHMMLVDLARNDVAKISKPGTRYVDEPFVVEKYSHVQHLVSNVRGILKDDLDALHAYMAAMNMGTLTGAPKVEAMKLLRNYEKTKRGFYGGAVCYITPSGELDSAITIRAIRLKNNKAYIRAGAGIVYDSDPEAEFLETERKAQACLKAIELA